MSAEFLTSIVIKHSIPFVLSCTFIELCLFFILPFVACPPSSYTHTQTLSLPLSLSHSFTILIPFHMTQIHAEPKTMELVFLVVSFVLDVPVLFSVGILSGYHIYCVSTNTTTIEGWEKGKVATMVRRGKIQDVKFPYDVGLYNNIKQVLGDNPLFWLWPKSAKGDGLHFAVAKDTGRDSVQLARLSSLSTLSTATRDRNGMSRPVSSTSIIVTCEDDEVRVPSRSSIYINMRELTTAHLNDRNTRSDMALWSPVSDTATLVEDGYSQKGYTVGDYKNYSKEEDSYDQYTFSHNLDRSDTFHSETYLETDMREVKIA
ncbi:hypothetical protein BC936DRAFT_146126 [Jimgerdemannia flammicorona]|uniref:Protein S-acyltransferase n=1 Tax=Jimgerdemannia flammicorona TaxID=994334 RepID=A0A433D8B5_9FUNG|nr:hypothetical protein BC936DRAFT_146126 [Jimgerdemannia flammicorona]